MFVGANPDDIPGFSNWLIQVCRRGGFRPKIVENADSITQTLSLLVAENAVALLPSLVDRLQVPGVTFRRLNGTAGKTQLAFVGSSPVLR